MEALKAFLERHPNIGKIYLNDRGEYMLSPHPKFPIEKDRNEIIQKQAMPIESVAKGNEPAPIQGSGKKRK